MRYPVHIEHQRADRRYAVVAARCVPRGVARRRPAAAAALVGEDLEPAEQLAQLVEADRLLFNGWSIDAGKQCDRERRLCLWSLRCALVRPARGPAPLR